MSTVQQNFIHVLKMIYNLQSYTSILLYNLQQFISMHGFQVDDYRNKQTVTIN